MEEGVSQNEDTNPEPPAVDVKKTASELDKYWQAVNDNPTDFTGWTYLLQYVEQENDLVAARGAFDAFLARYPYCYGYWKKYADLEKRQKNMDKAEEVFEAGLRAIALSIDLWVHYITFASNKYEKNPDREAITRKLFERAIKAAGTDFRSDKLWDMYILWERETNNIRNVTALFDRVLAIPTQMCKQHIDSFCDHVRHNHPKDMLELDEFLKLRQEVMSEKSHPVEDGDAAPGATAADAADEAAEDDEVEAPPGTAGAVRSVPLAPPGEEEAPPGCEGDGATVEDEEEIEALRQKIMWKRKLVHTRNEQEVNRRWSLEEGIRRPYFHVKPLERAQLRNWKDYLDFEIENGSHERVVVLFERCLIACALYEDIWLKYAKYMEPHGVEGVRDVFKRACTIHLTRKPSMHLAWAAFEERQGNYKTAIEVIDNLEKQVAGLAMVSLRRISLERRQGNFETTDTLYRECLERTQDQSLTAFYVIKYARYLAKVMTNVEAACTVLEDALKKDEDNVKLHLQLIDMEYQKASLDEVKMLSLFDRAIASPLSADHKVAFSQRKLEFLEDFGSNVGRIQEAYENHQKLLKELQASRKRKSQEGDRQDDSQKKMKAEQSSQSLGNGSSQGSVPCQVPMDPATAAYNYGQSWPGYSPAMGYNYQSGPGGWAGYSAQYYGSQ